jgi:hypothetical protein
MYNNNNKKIIILLIIKTSNRTRKSYLTSRAGSRSSLVDIAIRIEARRSRVSIPAEERDYFLLQTFHTGFWKLATSNSIGTRSFSGVNWLGREDHSLPPSPYMILWHGKERIYKFDIQRTVHRDIFL